MSSVEIKIGGLGGQGVILAGMIIGRGASLFGGKYSSLTQSFGPEARGSACSAQVVVSDEPVEYPYVTNPDILVVMSQEACNSFLPDVSPTGTLILEEELVTPQNVNPTITQYGIPSTRLAEELKRRMVANIVMVGFFAAVTDIVDVEAFRSSVKGSVPKGTESLNLSAFERGYSYGVEMLLKKSRKPAKAS
ncbi:MAG: 2-oxoacid:acceptor oxidoreductase family protein [Phycisphaerales bacterium]|nr:MAG: 2-oxoacid:acceptor oxidoreductase family protein [Phycisphaerales bacterium]